MFEAGFNIKFAHVIISKSLAQSTPLLHPRHHLQFSSLDGDAFLTSASRSFASTCGRMWRTSFVGTCFSHSEQARTSQPCCLYDSCLGLVVGGARSLDIGF